MERYHILLGQGYNNLRRSFGNPGSSPKTPSRESDVNFSDVFGGPPRRSSIHELRHTFGDTADTYAYGLERGEEEGLVSRSSWSALREKPVFGEECLVRRRYPSDDFFDDIFRGDESSSSTPRRPDRDPFYSTPASRIPSPVRPLASRPEPFGPSSLPTQLSIPPKLAGGMDFPVDNTSTSRSPRRSKDGAQNAGFPSSPGASISRVSNQVIQGKHELKNDARPSYSYSPLSHEFSLSSGESSKATACVDEEKGSSRSVAREEHFHFSIYKWTSKGVPLVFRGGNSSSSKERGNNSSSSSSKERSKSEIVASELSIEIPFLNDGFGLSSMDSSFHIESENQGSISVLNSVAEDRIDSFRFNEKAECSKPGIEPPLSLGNITTEVPHGLTMQKEVKETNPFSGLSVSSPDKGIKKEAKVFMQEKEKTEIKSLHSLFYENSDGKGKDGMVGQAEGKEDKNCRVETIGTSSGNIAGGKRLEKQDKRKILDLAPNSSLQGTGANSRDNFLGNKVKGKIKEFVKIFNHEAPPNNISNVGTQVYSSRWKEKGTSEADDGSCVSATKVDGKENVTNFNGYKTLTNGQALVDQTLKQPEKSHFILNESTLKAYDTSSGTTSNSASCSETIPASFQASLVNVEESHHEDLQGSYLVKELSPNQNRQQTFEYREEIEILDARIRQWSNGKETNIRALLSTLQYVLWPESGWKPVPLVDIIEGNSVKRAYQKVLLCLHPDKLQQRGAAPQQKYIAEKVYDILQEAWTHFNSLSSF